MKYPCSSPQVSPYSDVTVRRWSSLLYGVWLLPSISRLTPFDRSATTTRTGLEVGITRAFVHVTRNGRATCELLASVGKRTLHDVAGPNRASAPVYSSLWRPRPARNRLDLHDADRSFPAINFPLVAVIWAVFDLGAREGSREIPHSQPRPVPDALSES